jgi:hypothetical protein
VVLMDRDAAMVSGVVPEPHAFEVLRMRSAPLGRPPIRQPHARHRVRAEDGLGVFEEGGGGQFRVADEAAVPVRNSPPGGDLEEAARVRPLAPEGFDAPLQNVKPAVRAARAGDALPAHDLVGVGDADGGERLQFGFVKATEFALEADELRAIPSPVFVQPIGERQSGRVLVGFRADRTHEAAALVHDPLP